MASGWGWGHLATLARIFFAAFPGLPGVLGTRMMQPPRWRWLHISSPLLWFFPGLGTHRQCSPTVSEMTSSSSLYGW